MKFRSKRLLAITATVGLVSLYAGTAGAEPITGTVNISGSVAVGATTIDFQPPIGPPNGAFVVSDTGNTGSFASLNNTAGLILDLDETKQTPGLPFATLTGFVTFAAAPNIRFDLTSIDPGNFTSANCFVPPAAGQTCTPPGFSNGAANPFDLVNTSATTSTASLTVRGNAVNTSTGETDQYIGILTTQFTIPYQMLLSEVQSGQVATSYSGTFTVNAVPEPASFFLFGSSLIGIAALCRYARKRVS